LIVQESALTDAEEETVRKFIDSATYSDKGEKCEWKLPEGWREEKGKAGANIESTTLLFGPADSPYKLTVSKLGPLAARGPNTLAGNVNRWRGQIGLGVLTDEELAESGDVVKTRLGGVDAVLLDIGGIDPAILGKQATAEAPKGPFAFKKPDAWRELGVQEVRQIPFAVMAFEVEDGDRRVLVTVSPMKGDGGGLDANLARWADQVGFKADNLADLKKQVRKGEVSRGEADLVDFAGPKERMLVAWVPRPGLTWAFKMKGPADLMAAQKDNFETFLKSVTFPEA
jgi:hypothetical protein